MATDGGPLSVAMATAVVCIIDCPLLAGERYPCAQCLGVRSYGTHNDLKKHQRRHHPEVNMIFRCRQCFDFFASPKHVNHHLSLCAMAGAAIHMPVSPQHPAGFSPESIARGLAFVRQLVEQEQNLVDSPVHHHRLSPRSLEGSPIRVVRDVDDDEIPFVQRLDLPEPTELLSTTPTTTKHSRGHAPRRVSLWSYRGETNVFPPPPPLTPSPLRMVVPDDSRPPQWMEELHQAHGYLLGLINPSPLAGMAQQTVEVGPNPAEDTATTEAGPNPARDVGPSPRNPATSEAGPNPANDLTPLTEARPPRASDVRCPPFSHSNPGHHSSRAPSPQQPVHVENRPCAIPRPVVNNGRPRRHVWFASDSSQSFNCRSNHAPTGSSSNNNTDARVALNEFSLVQSSALDGGSSAVNNNNSRAAAAVVNSSSFSFRPAISAATRLSPGAGNQSGNVAASDRVPTAVSNNNNSSRTPPAAGSNNIHSSRTFVSSSRHRVAGNRRPGTTSSYANRTVMANNSRRGAGAANNNNIRRGAGVVNNSGQPTAAAGSNSHPSVTSAARHTSANHLIPVASSGATRAAGSSSSSCNNNNNSSNNRFALLNDESLGETMPLDDGDAGAVNNNNNSSIRGDISPPNAASSRPSDYVYSPRPSTSRGILTVDSVAADDRSPVVSSSCAGTLNNSPTGLRAADRHVAVAATRRADTYNNNSSGSRSHRPPRTSATRRQPNATESSSASRRRNDRPPPLTGRAAHFRDTTVRQFNRRQQQQQQPRGMAVTGNRAADYFNQQVAEGQPPSPRSPSNSPPPPGPPPPPAAGEEEEDAEPLRLTADQRRWMDELEAMANDDLGGITRVAEEITTAAAVRVEMREARGRVRANNDARHRPPPSRSNRRRPAAAHPLFDPADASKIQKLYRLDRKKAVTGILSGDSPYCDVTADALHQHLTTNFAGGDHQWSHPPPPVPDLAAPATEEEIDYLTRPFTADEVANRLSRMANTAPGPDGARYSGLRRIDPGCHTMAQLFTNCHVLGEIPASWKESTTVMAYKGAGDRADMGNWRPLSLGNTIAKLYSGCIADRLTRWGEENGRISPEQKGFTSHDGCVEHNFIVQSAIDQARRTGEGLCVAFLDIANAFGVIPHTHIIGTLQTIGLPQQLLTVIDDLYTGNTTRGMSSEGLTEPVPIVAGVKQGCPLSPVIFNYSMEPIIKAISATKATTGFRVGGQLLAVLAYADDLVLLARSEFALQVQLDTAVEVAEWCHLQFKPPKCGTLHIEKKKVRDSSFTIQETELVALKDGEHYRHLGVPTGFRCRQTPEETLERLAIDFNLLDRSLLAPWQKIDAAATFLIPRLDFILRGANVRVQPLNALDKRVKRIVKGWLNLPSSSTWLRPEAARESSRSARRDTSCRWYMDTAC